MKHFLRKIVIVTLTFPVVWFVFIGLYASVAPEAFKKSLVYHRVSSGHMFTRLEEAGEFGHVDVLVTGSSHAYRGFDPRVFAENGLSLFNLGSSSQTPIQTEFLLDRYLDVLTPEVVLLEVYPDLFSNDGTESSWILFQSCPPIWRWFRWPHESTSRVHTT